MCNVLPCAEPCHENLKCGHPCVGFCGDPCPILCRICDNEELTEIFLGDEDEEDGIYVMLENCKHIFEHKNMDQWMELDGDEIKAKECPRCKTTITKSRRYNDILKRNMDDLVAVKNKSYGILAENKANVRRLQQKLDKLLEEHAQYLSKYYNSVLPMCHRFNT